MTANPRLARLHELAAEAGLTWDVAANMMMLEFAARLCVARSNASLEAILSLPNATFAERAAITSALDEHARKFGPDEEAPKMGPRREGSPMCESGSVASGGAVEYCTCDTCF